MLSNLYKSGHKIITCYSFHKMKFITAIVLLVSVIGLFMCVEADPEPSPRNPWENVRYTQAANILLNSLYLILFAA